MTQIPPGFAEQDEQPRPPASAAAQERVARLRAFVGRRLDPAVLEELRAFTPNRLRVLHPGEVRTMDFLQDRLNVEVDRHEIIRSLTFG